MAFVLEGPCDRSLARSAWDITIPRNRPVGYGPILAGVRTSIRRLKYWSDQVSEVRTEEKSSGLGYNPLHRTAARTSSGISSRYRCCPTGRFPTRKTCGISRVRSYRTLRDGSFGDAFQALRARLRSACPSG